MAEFFDWNAARGVWYETEDSPEGLIIHTKQDVQPSLDWAKKQRNNGLNDPGGKHEHRYWDGSQWTEHVSDDGETAIDQPGDAELPPPPPRGAAGAMRRWGRATAARRRFPATVARAGPPIRPRPSRAGDGRRRCSARSSAAR